MAQVAKRNMTETWREAVERRGRELGRAAACLDAFDAALAQGRPEHEAAFAALRACGALFEVDLPGDPVRAGKKV